MISVRKPSRKKLLGACLFLILFLFLLWVVFPVKSLDSSMEPNIGKGVWVFVKRNVLGASLSDGKVVLYRNQDNREKLGRIYASAGESVAFFDQSLYLKKNGKIYIFNEFGKGRNYVDPRVSDVENQWILMGEGQYFVLPDGWESGPIEFKDQIIDQRKIIGEVI